MLVKKDLRARLKKQRNSLSLQDVRRKSLAAQDHILRHPFWQDAQDVLLYVAFQNEVETDLLINDALERGVRVFLPRCCPCTPEQQANGLMDLAQITHVSQIKPGAYGIGEPDPHACPAQENCAPQLAIIPALAFDARGYRLGYGGGYYDRLLAGEHMQQTRCVGLGYAFQLVRQLPTEPWDKPVHAICTEEALQWL